MNTNNSESGGSQSFRKSQFEGKILGNFKVIRDISLGRSGSVHTCLDLTNNTTKAIKICKNHEYIEDVNLLRTLNCEFIIKYYDHFEYDFFFIIVMEYAENGDLSTLIEESKRNAVEISLSRIFKWAIQATKALKVLHSNRIIHRDVKPSSLLLSKEDNLKLGCLGISKSLEEYSEDFGSHTPVGTPFYMSPEIINGGEYSFNTDIWSLGCAVYELNFLHVPFKAFSFDRNVENLNFENSIFTNLIKKMLIVNPKERPTSAELYEYMKDVENDFA